MKVARSRALRRRKLRVLVPIRTNFLNKLEKSILNLISGACLTNMLFHTACQLPKAALHHTALGYTWALQLPLLNNRCDFHIPETGDYRMK